MMRFGMPTRPADSPESVGGTNRRVGVGYDGRPASRKASVARGAKKFAPVRATKTGFSVRPATAASVLTIASTSLSTRTQKQAITRSTFGSSATAPKHRSKTVMSDITAAVTSTGFAAEPNAGTNSSSRFVVSGVNSASTRLAEAIASVARMPEPPEVETIASARSGWTAGLGERLAEIEELVDISSSRDP